VLFSGGAPALASKLGYERFRADSKVPQDKVAEFDATVGSTVWPACSQIGSRDCSKLPPPTETLKSVFGAVEAGLNIRIERALWTMGALGGTIPDGVFSQPTPVANFNVYATAPALAVYGDSRINASSNLQSQDTGYSSLEDVVALGKVEGYTTDWVDSRDWTSLALDGLKTSLRTYTPAGAFYVTQSELAEVAFGDEIQGVSYSRGTRAGLATWLDEFGAALSQPTLVPGILDATRSLSASVIKEPVAQGGPMRYFLEGCEHGGSPVFTEAAGSMGVSARLVAKDDCPFDSKPGTALAPGLNNLASGLSSYNPDRSYFIYGTTGNVMLTSTSTLGGSALVDDLGGCSGSGYNIIGYRLKASVCPKEERVRFMVNRRSTTATAAGDDVLRAMTLSCLGSGSAPRQLVPPAAINSVADVRRLEGWLAQAEYATATGLNDLALANVPKRVVDAEAGGALLSSASGQGTHGELLLALGNEIRAVHGSWVTMSGAFGQLRNAIHRTRKRLEAASQKERAAQLEYERERIELDRRKALGALQTTSGIMKAALSLAGMKKGSEGEGLNGLIDGVTSMQAGFIESSAARQLLGVLAKEEDNGDQAAETERELVLIDLNEDSSAAYTALETSLSGLRTGASNALAKIIELQGNALGARTAVAKAAGADFMTDLDGNTIPLPVNSVLNRQLNLKRLRYERALTTAKRSAYLARLAIEQRLGLRLDELKAELGPLPAPSTWVDDLCTMQGVNYETLRTATQGVSSGSGTGGAAATPGQQKELDLIAGFADEYIGDYVQKLEELVSFYNVENPFRESDDTMVLSLREDLLVSDHRCQGESRNLLYHSGALHEEPPSSSDVESLGGWRSRQCTGGACTTALSGLGLMDADVPLVPPNGRGSISWLRTISETDRPAAAASPVPRGAVYQSVRLVKGRDYVLSWWDMARAANGKPLDTGSPQGYQVAAFTGDWNLVATSLQTSHRGAESSRSEWSPRRSLRISVPQDGVYHVAFIPEPAVGEVTLALANVQLEELSAERRGPGYYEHTTSYRLTNNSDCKASESWSVQEAFERKCERRGQDSRAEICWWELKQPIALDAVAAQQGYGPLFERLALDNKNYRHVSTVVNIVGDALNCGEGAGNACYASGYLEYDLSHAAYSVPLMDLSGHNRCFDFGVATIHHGKALSTERYLSVPLSSADESLTNQAAFKKWEFAGRPLTGVYRLRIKDSRRLRWDLVEDIQLLVNYRYWSPVDRAN
jgi:hypothetical protein